MPGSARRPRLPTRLAGALAALALPCLALSAQEVPMDIASLAPDSLGAWRAEDGDERFDRRTIYRYMDGAAEVYLSFAFTELFVRRYRGPDGARLTLEIYDMGRGAEAFGIFSRNRRGEEAGIGQGSELRSGYLVFWQGRCFVTVYADRDEPTALTAVRELGEAVAGRIGTPGRQPDLVDALPAADLAPASIRYFHLHTDLNQHYFVADDNLLDLAPDTDAVLGCYERGAEYAYLLIVRYPEPERCAAALAAYLLAFTPEAGAGQPARLEDGTWTVAARRGRYLLAVYDAGSSGRATGLLAAAGESLERSRR